MEACTGKDWWPLVVRQLVSHHGGGMHWQRLWTSGGQTASCSSWRRCAQAKTGGLVVVRKLVAHHGGVHGQRLVACGGQTASCSSWRRRALAKTVDRWWSDSYFLILEAVCTGKDWWTYGCQTASCSSWRRRARAKTGGPVVVRQLVAHLGGVHGQRLVDRWWSDS